MTASERLQAEGAWRKGILLVQLAGFADFGVQGEVIALSQLLATRACGGDGARYHYRTDAADAPGAEAATGVPASEPEEPVEVAVEEDKDDDMIGLLARGMPRNIAKDFVNIYALFLVRGASKSDARA